LDYDLVLEGATVTPTGTRELQIGVNGGRIGEIRRQGLRGAQRIVVPSSCVIFPGFIDTHVHLREPGWEHKEDFASGTAAAAHGGVTTVFDMPNNPVPATDVKTLEAKAELARSRGEVDIRLLGGVGAELSTIQKIRKLVVGYKIYLAQTTGNLLTPDGRLREVLAAVGRAGKPASVHCELQTILDQRREDLAGQDRPDLHSDLRPPEAEIESVRMVLAARRKTKVNFCHISTAEALRLLELSRSGDSRVACEVALHHLFFSRNDMYRSELLKVNPPLRSESDREAMVLALRTGKIDFLVTDHAPHTLTEKRKEGACGVPGLDNYGNLVAWLIRGQEFSFETVAAITSGNQARFYGLGDRGAIAVGKRADLTVIDLKAPEKASSRTVRSKCGWTPYEGVKFPGRVRWTFFEGRRLVDDFELDV